MNNLPYEVIALIGSKLLPKWRCRLFLCCKEWYQKCYQGNIEEHDLFSWHCRGALCGQKIRQLVHQYSCPKGVNIEIGHIVNPHWGNRRVMTVHNLSDCFIITRKSQFSNHENRIMIQYDIPEYIFELYAQFYANSDNSFCGQLYDNFDDICLYLNKYDRLRLVIAMGFYYYALLKSYVTIVEKRQLTGGFGNLPF